jgi:hypothetical protein
MKISNPYTSMPVKMTPETVSSELSKDGGKAKATYPSGHITNQPGGGGKTSGSFKHALTPGSSPTGS